MKTFLIIIAALALTACGQPPDQVSAVADAPAPAPAAIAAIAPAVAGAPVALTKTDIQEMLDAARLDTAQQIAIAQAAQAEKAAAEKSAANDKAATEKRIQRAERTAAQARAEAAKPVFANVPRRVCEQKPAPAPERNTLGMLAGAALGALGGNQIGGGQGRTIATIAGAGAGAYAGDAFANSGKPGTTEVCHDVIDHVRVR